MNFNELLILKNSYILLLDSINSVRIKVEKREKEGIRENIDVCDN